MAESNKQMPHCTRPCAECPWRKDIAPGQFNAERFRRLAVTAADLSTTIFACHKSTQGNDVACAGFLLRGATHNLAVRLAAGRRLDMSKITDGGHPLHDDYRAMARANGVARNDPAMRQCR